jgi:pimeloyl-ACP methyl ester carboxylesterase
MSNYLVVILAVLHQTGRLDAGRRLPEYHFRPSPDSAWLTRRRALKLAMQVVTKVTGQTQAAFFGQSSGALRAARFANVHPQHVSKLMLDAIVWTGKASPTLAKRKKMLHSVYGFLSMPDRIALAAPARS